MLEVNAEKYLAKPAGSEHKPDRRMLERQVSVLGEMLIDSMGVKAYNERVRDFGLEQDLQEDDVVVKIHALQNCAGSGSRTSPAGGLYGCGAGTAHQDYRYAGRKGG